jgi:hypothetical protein
MAADLTGFIRKLTVPEGFTVPESLSHEDIVATALTRDDLDDDVRGINASLELIGRTRGGGWPAGAVTPAENYVDLVWHELEFREGTSFAYVVRTGDGTYLGCCYLYAMGQRTELTDALLEHDVDVSWWVTTEAYERGYYEKLYAALRRWVAGELPFENPFYSNREIPAS